MKPLLRPERTDMTDNDRTPPSIEIRPLERVLGVVEQSLTRAAKAPRAVFLSYASDDAAAAVRICESLQAAGIEVWFDQSELRGGDAWDAAIRRQIKQCALFMAVISENTHARVEGYFRLEWKLAVDRSHFMAPDQRFLLPVVIDGTPQTDERIPERLREMHWLSAPAGETTAAFIQRVLDLLSRDPLRTLTAESAPAERVRFGPPPVARLPARIDILIGRELELNEMAELVRTHRAVTVLGPGGIGKTQCVLELARRISAEFADGVWFFDLVPIRKGADWLQALRAVLAIPAADTNELLARIVSMLQGRRMLIVLDNCDRVAAEVGAIVIELLRGADTVKVLATSQAPLNFIGERVMRLPPLALPEAALTDQLALEGIAATPAVEMLLTRIRSHQPAFQLTEANAANIVEICHRLDGMPLALELAAARFTLLTPDQVLQRLEQRFRFLSSTAAGRDDRHQNLLALLDWSFSLLSAPEQQLLRWFSVFVQGWTVDSAVEMAASLGHDPDAALEILASLVNKCLVAAIPAMSAPRYRLLESVRSYACNSLHATDEETRAHETHVAVVVKMCAMAEADMLAGRMREQTEHLMHEHGNVAAALDYALDTKGDHASALRIVGSLMLYLKVRSFFVEASKWCERALAGTETLETRERGRALLCLGVATVHSGKTAGSAAGSVLLEAARIAALSGDKWGEAYANVFYAMWLCNWGRSQLAVEPTALVERIAEELDDPLLRGSAGLARGWILISAQDYAMAVTVLRAVRNLGSDLHHRHFVDMYIGLSLFALGEYPAAAAQWLQALRTAAALFNARGMGGACEGCGYICARVGLLQDAVRFLASAHKVRERTAVPLFNFWVAHHDATVAALRAKLDSAEFEALWSAGQRMREEDIVNEVSGRLRDFSVMGQSAN
jgi:non-specific serine/threonine protein kinase